jgi:transcriptional regulator with PAS, ATPase and Fis domain
MPEAPRRSNRSTVLRHAVAIVSVASAVILAQLLERHWHSTPFVSLMVSAIMLSAWFGGYGPGFLAVALAALALDYYFLPPIHSLAINSSEMPRLILFLLSASMVALLAAAQRSTTESLKVARDDLAATVHELKRSNQALQAENTERRQAETALQRSESYLAEAQRLSHTGSFGWRPSTGEVLWSEETFRIFQHDRAMRPTMDLVLQRVHHEDSALVKQTFERAFRDGKNFDLEHRLVMIDGAVKFLRVVAHGSRDVAGNVEFVGAAMDITAMKEAFREIQALRDQLFEENVALREEIDKASMFEEIVGGSPPLQAVLSRVTKVAPTESTVLITGETGTGKELFARAIHKRSPRSARAFVSVNCAAIPPSLIASELFGHEKGAFTGALQKRVGRFEAAEGGTIFLDEIGELPMETQVALLRALQEREFERVGGSQTIRVDVRVVAATNRDLETAIAAGSFRNDLFYRLNVFPIEVPALRERRGDIPVLVSYFIDRYASRQGKKIRSLSKRSLDLLQAYDWPGNIRELQNVIERSVIVCETDTLVVDEGWLVREGPPAGQALAVELTSHEKELIEAALTESRGRVSGPAGAAARLGVPASTLESKIRALRIPKQRFKPG